MNSVMLFCACWLGSGLYSPDFWGLQTENQHGFQLELRLVDVSRTGKHECTCVPAIALTDGDSVRFQCQSVDRNGRESRRWQLVDEETEAGAKHSPISSSGPICNSEWGIRVRHLDNGKVSLDLTIQRHQIEKAVKSGMLQQGASFRLRQQVTPGNSHRVILTHDDQGRPDSWIDVRIRTTRTDEDSPASEQDDKPNLDGTVHPFWYEPF